MRSLIQVRWRPGWGAAQPSSTASKSLSISTVKRSDRTVRARREDTRNWSSGMIPRSGGSYQWMAGSSALSAIGKMPQELAMISFGGWYRILLAQCTALRDGGRGHCGHWDAKMLLGLPKIFAYEGRFL